MTDNGWFITLSMLVAMISLAWIYWDISNELSKIRRRLRELEAILKRVADEWRN